MRRILKLGAALDDGMLLALLSLYVFKCNEVSVLYTVCLRRLRRLSALCCARRAAAAGAASCSAGGALERYTSITS